MYEFALAGSEFHQHGVKGNTVPYQQMTTALQQEVNVRAQKVHLYYSVVVL